MKQTSYQSLIFFCLIAISTLTGAQTPNKETAAERLEEVVARLELTDEQVESVRPILEKSADRRQAILASYGIDAENAGTGGQQLGIRRLRALRSELSAVRADTRADLQDILTEQQMDEFTKIEEERQEMMRAKIRAGRNRSSGSR